MIKKILFSLLVLGIGIQMDAQSPIIACQIDNGSIYDVSGSNDHPQAIGDFTFAPGANGGVNGAINFNGEAYLNLERVDQLDVIDELTICTWVRKNPSTTTTWRALVNKWDDTGFYLGINPNSSTVRFNIAIDNVEDVTPLIDNTWVHFAASYNGSKLKLYRDGVLVASKSVIGNIASNGAPLLIGTQSNINLFTSPDVSMDEILIYDEALSDMAIQDIYNGNYNLNQNDIAVLSVQNKAYTDQLNEVKGQLINLGTETLTSFDLHWTIGADTYTQSFSGLDIGTNELFEYTHQDALSMAIGDVENLTVWADNPNGAADENDANNEVVSSVIWLDFIPVKKVLVEEATANWCQPCVRGIAGLKYMEDKYEDNFIAIAFHGLDTLSIPDFVDGFTAWPMSRVDRRGIFVDPSPFNLESSFLYRLEDAALASIDNYMTYNAETRQITAKVSSKFAIPVSGDFRFNLMVVENEITGEGEAFEQGNAFSGSTNGLCGFELLPDPIPADQMVFQHVARAVLGGLEGVEGSLPNSLDLGTTYDYTFSYTIPLEFDDSQIDVIATIIDTDGNEVLNSILIHLEDATIVTSTQELLINESYVKIFPNPTKGLVHINLNLDRSEEISLKVFNTLGQKILNRDYGKLQGEMTLPLNVRNLENGLYTVQVRVGKKLTSKKLVVKK